MSSPIERAFERDDFYQSEHPTKAELEAELGDPQAPHGLAGADIRLMMERVFIAANGAVYEDPAAQEIGASAESPVGLLFQNPAVSCITVTRSTGETVTYRRPNTADDL